MLALRVNGHFRSWVVATNSHTDARNTERNNVSGGHLLPTRTSITEAPA